MAGSNDQKADVELGQSRTKKTSRQSWAPQTKRQLPVRLWLLPSQIRRCFVLNLIFKNAYAVWCTKIVKKTQQSISFLHYKRSKNMY